MEIQPEEMTPQAHLINPDEMTLEQIKEQMALYSRLYYQKRRNDKEYMERKRKML